MAQIDFDANAYEPSTGFNTIPAAYYPAHMTNSDKRDAKSGNGWYLWFEFEIRDGEFKGRKVFMNLNLGNNNAEAVRIANAQFSALCRAVGKMKVTDTTQLHMLPLEIKVTVRPERDGYEASNEIRGFRPLAPSATTPPPAGGQAGVKQPGWGRA